MALKSPNNLMESKNKRNINFLPSLPKLNNNNSKEIKPKHRKKFEYNNNSTHTLYA